MNIRKLGVAAAAMLLCGIAFTYLLFEQGQTTAAATVPEKKTVRGKFCRTVCISFPYHRITRASR